MEDYMTQEDAMNMSIEQAIAVLVPLRDTMLDQHGCPISDAYFALDKVIQYAERRGKWVKDEQESLKHIEAIYRCSACNNFDAWGETEKYNYCPYCGARMDLESEKKDLESEDE